jgi:hypothetical protein
LYGATQPPVPTAAVPLCIAHFVARFAGLLLALIHRSAWNRNSANFAITEF